MRKETEQKAISVLKNHPCFAAATEEELARLLRDDRTLLREFVKGQTVFPAHGTAQSFGLLLSGGCLVKRGGKIVREAPGGSLFALESLFGARRESTETYVAQADGKALFISQAAVEALMQENFAAARDYLTFLADQIDALNGLVAAAGSGSAEAKTAAFLMEHKKPDRDEIVLTPDFSKLSRQIGISRDALSRALDRLTAAGAIGFRGRSLTVKDAELLQKFSTEKEE